MGLQKFEALNEPQTTFFSTLIDLMEWLLPTPISDGDFERKAAQQASLRIS